ncbi:MAG: hypothetical protein HRT99_04080 [Mycoplasmatales bacterium]|nr:hypothetical protein [Mycoplasmatales bacterium]
MEIKPMYDNTIKMSVKNVKLESLKIKENPEKAGLIPNGIWRVIRWEKIRQIFTIIMSGLILLFTAILTALYATKMDVLWAAYIIPGILIMLTSWKLLNTLIERGRLVKSIERYKEDLKIGLESTPPFISNLYMSLHIKQVAHNWLTFITIFYGGIITVLLWWLKDFSWWIFDFKSWIHNLFADPEMMTWLFTSLLIAVSVLHIIFAIQRKKKILDINSYFGSTLAPISEIETIKQSKNKMYRRLFIISVMIILVIPILVRFSLKIISGKK